MKLGFTSKAIQEHEAKMAIKKARIYISGKITGCVNLNREKFEQMEVSLIFRYGEDIQVVNPHRLLHLHDKTWASFMREDLRHLMACTIIVPLDDWKKSRGAITEMLLAQLVAIPAYKLTYDGLVPFKVGFWLKVWLLIKLTLKLV